MSEQKAISLEKDPKRHFYEIRGASFLDRLSRVTKDEPFLVRFLSVIWVSGPVTLIALSLAYYVREKTLPEASFVVYLMLFSFITGIVSIITGIFRKAYLEEKGKEENKKLLKVISFVPELVLSIRNIYLKNLDPRARAIEASYYLLQIPNLASESIKCAVFDIFQNKEMAELFGKMEIYRRRGLLSRVHDYAQEIKNNYLKEIEDLGQENPRLSEHLLRRLDGYAPSYKRGKRRKPDFLLNIQRAIDEENYELFDLQDAEEFLKLLLEILIGREFIVFRWFINGSERVRGTFERYEKLLLLRRRKIVKYRKALRRRKNKIAMVKEAKRSIQETNRNLEKIKKRAHEIFVAGNNNNENLSIRFEKSKVYLSDPERMELIENLEEKLPLIRSIVAIRKISEVIEEDDDTKLEIMDEQELKNFVIEVFDALNKLVDFTDLALCESIQSVRGINITGVDVFETRKTMVGWLDTLLDELDENLNPVALETCQRIVNIIRAPLYPKNIQDILKNFNLNQEVLTQLRPEDTSNEYSFF